ncbi:Polysaccharide deacetylase [Algoriphagus ornithinivorans]|uniref:Polysaccharide deacetylase n=1 Tax=Algoriphagus ornithinivorans TaxID=226506 RepID=A0A1I5HH58_9BACT|nr:polysaccharide deacetylase family protein [Algoriphagus ornithinivorans]SFO47573.1 Polysaccharide deacetylase [Algoriphagus ornithinivorans]
MQSPILVISLDFELHWGRFDKYSLSDYQYYYQNTLKVIPEILSLFQKYEVHATWAMVGMLMAKNWEEWEAYSPSIQPQFENKVKSAYEWAKAKPNLDGLFAPELIKQIIDLDGQELGTHTFSHFYTGEKGASLSAFSEDLKACRKISLDKYGIEPVSLVFPRNQYDDKVLLEAKNAGIRFVRTNPEDWFWKNTAKETLVKKVFRTGDTLIKLGKKTSYSQVIYRNGLVEIPASRLLRPYRKGSVFNATRINRIKSELVEACDRKEIYHLWWHPHNFGFLPSENLRILEELLKFIYELKNEKGLFSMNMQELALNSELIQTGDLANYKVTN